MKKIKLQLDGIKEMLSKDQMKRIIGGEYDTSGQCGTVSNCSTGSCNATCSGGRSVSGTCGLSNHSTVCDCAYVCI